MKDSKKRFNGGLCKKDGFSTFLRGCNPVLSRQDKKSVHYRAPKLKQFLQSRNYIYF